MLSTASRAAGGLARSLLAAVCGAAGTVVGAVVGLLCGFVNEEGLLQGTFVGAIIGAIVSVEVADSLVRIWCCDEYCSMDARIKRSRLVLRNIGLGRVLRGSAFPSMSSALDGQMDALQLHHHHYGGADRGDLLELEPSLTVMAARRAAVESLPSTTLTKETTAQQHATCPICLHDFQAGESARKLPACGHVFHLACIDGWLLGKPQCPMCRHGVY